MASGSKQSVTKAKQKAKKRPRPAPKATKSGAKRVQSRPGLTTARVRKVALDFADLTSADAHLGRRFDLVTLLSDHDELAAAWRRGRFLRDLRRAAACGMSIAEAAYDMQLTYEELSHRLSNDIEVAGIWNGARFDVSIELKTAWKEKAKEGNARAMAQVEASLRNEIAHASLDIHTLPEEKMAEVAGVNVSTLYRWRQGEGLPRNSGVATYDLQAVWQWFEGFVKRRCRGTVVDADPLRAQKARREELQNAELEGTLWDRDTVIASLTARAQALAETLSAAKASELGQRLDGQPAPQIARTLEAFFTDAKRAACRIDDELKLPAAARDAWAALLAAIEVTE